MKKRAEFQAAKAAEKEKLRAKTQSENSSNMIYGVLVLVVALVLAFLQFSM